MKPKRILVVDDESSIRKFLKISLESNQFEVEEASSGQEAIQQMIARKPDLMILDLGLPDLDGQKVIIKIREWSQIPIIVLTVQDSEDEKVQALDSGADDYLTKPFSVPELMARIRVVLRRGPTATDEMVFKSGEFEMDFNAHMVRISGSEVKLTATEYSLLQVLVKNAGKVVTHRMLLKEIWGPNAVEHTQYLRVYMGQIRKKFHEKMGVKEDAPEFITTEAGVGYRFVLQK
ncbi:MAG: response regulator [Pseudobdellovibrionaceae bacterium]